jgi:hypothetical protein
MNLRIKHRESFRPFAPSVLIEEVGEYFELDRESPYMLLVAEVRKERRCTLTEEQKALQRDPDLRKRMNVKRSDIPAVTMWICLPESRQGGRAATWPVLAADEGIQKANGLRCDHQHQL